MESQWFGAEGTLRIILFEDSPSIIPHCSQHFQGWGSSRCSGQPVNARIIKYFFNSYYLFLLGFLRGSERALCLLGAQHFPHNLTLAISLEQILPCPKLPEGLAALFSVFPWKSSFHKYPDCCQNGAWTPFQGFLGSSGCLIPPRPAVGLMEVPELSLSLFPSFLHLIPMCWLIIPIFYLFFPLGMRLEVPLKTKRNPCRLFLGSF